MIKNQPKWTMAYMDIHYPHRWTRSYWSVPFAFLKTLDFLSAQTAKRLTGNGPATSAPIKWMMLIKRRRKPALTKN